MVVDKRLIREAGTNRAECVAQCLYFHFILLRVLWAIEYISDRCLLCFFLKTKSQHCNTHLWITHSKDSLQRQYAVDRE